MKPEERVLGDHGLQNTWKFQPSPDPRSLLAPAEISASLTKATCSLLAPALPAANPSEHSVTQVLCAFPLFRNWDRTNHSALLARRVSLHLAQPLELPLTRHQSGSNLN